MTALIILAAWLALALLVAPPLGMWLSHVAADYETECAEKWWHGSDTPIHDQLAAECAERDLRDESIAAWLGGER